MPYVWCPECILEDFLCLFLTELRHVSVRNMEAIRIGFLSINEKGEEAALFTTKKSMKEIIAPVWTKRHVRRELHFIFIYKICTLPFYITSITS